MENYFMTTKSNETQLILDNNGIKITDINPDYINSSNFSLNLFGENLTELSNALNENFIRLAQNFYSTTQPINPVIGQRWLNKNDNITYMWIGKNWIQQSFDSSYDSFMFVKHNIGQTREFVLDEFVFNFTIKNIKLYNQDMNDVKFIIDPFDSRKIILKESGISTVYILVFHPRDRISNPLINKRMEYFTESGQTQFDITSILNGSDLNTLSVTLNDMMLRNNEFYVVNNILNIDGKIYRVRKNDKITVWMHGGSLTGYFTNLRIHTSGRESYIKIPKFFKKIISMEIYDIDEKVGVNPIETIEYDDYYYFEFLDKKNIIINAYTQII